MVPEIYTACTSRAPKSTTLPESSYERRTISMLPAVLPCLSSSRTSVRDVHFASGGKKNPAAASTNIQSCRNRIGQVTTTFSPSKILHTPSGSSALSFVQLGTLLLKGHNRFVR